MPEWMILIKLVVSVSFVVTLSLIAEQVSPRVAGLLSGYPLGAAIALFFFGLEMGPGYASQSAIYTMSGLAATLCFVYVYYKISTHCKRLSILSSTIASVSGYFVVIWLLHFIPVNRIGAVALPLASLLGFVYLFRQIENVPIGRKIQLNAGVLFVRALVAGGAILAITGAARWVDSRWAGLFSAFPVTLLPLLVIVHFTHGIGAVHTVIKNFPHGLGALITYALTVSVVYPVWGIYAGTALSFGAATGYLLIYQAVRNHLHAAKKSI
jgi:uncharacterized membrane protein (GlpM family)